MPEQSPQISELQGKIQSRRNEAKASKNPQVTAERSMAEGTQIEVPQSPTARLLLHSIDASFVDIKSDPRMTVDLLPAYAKEAQELKQGINKLDYQYHTNSIDVPVSVGKDSKLQFMHVTELDIARPPVGEKDERIPYIMIGGAGSTTEQNAMLAMALALEGKRVKVISFPEQNQGRMVGGRSMKDKISNTRELQMESFKKTIQHLGHEKMNFVGHSLGAAQIIELASDQDFAGKVNDIISLAPVGFEKQNVLSMGKRFGDQGGFTKNDPESKVAMLDQGNIDAAVSSKLGLVDFIGLGKAAAQHTVTDNVLAGALQNMTGELQVWAGERDTVSRPDAIHGGLKNFVQDHPEYTDRVASYTVTGGYHDLFITHALGLTAAGDREAEHRERGKPYLEKAIGADTLVRSGSEWILSKMKAEASVNS